MKPKNRIDRIEELIAKISEREEYYEAFLHSSPWGILVVDEDFRIVYMNHTMERMSGYNLEDINGEHLHLLIPPEDREVHAAHEEDFRNRPRVRLGDHPFQPNIWNSEGERVPVEISLSPAEVNGKIFYYASIRPRESLPVKEE